MPGTQKATNAGVAPLSGAQVKAATSNGIYSNTFNKFVEPLLCVGDYAEC